jgi:phosphatidate cytidylyltransferase
MRTRIVSAIIGIILAGYIINAGGWLFFFGVLALNIISIYELHRAFENLDIHTAIYISSFFALLLLYVVAFMQNTSFIFVPFSIVLMIIFIFLYSIINNNRNDLIDVVFTVFSFVYTSILFMYFMLIRFLPLGRHFVWWVFVITWACDTGAFFTGTLFGKKKITPTISPHKTIEGSIGGLLLSAVVSTIFAKLFLLDVSIINAAVLGAIVGIFSELGDISASLIKRYCGIKDFSNIIPGHGGILDRFDSALFSFPVAYYYIVFILKKGGF